MERLDNRASCDQPRIGNLSPIEAQFGEARQARQMLQTKVGDAGPFQFEFRELRQPLQIRQPRTGAR